MMQGEINGRWTIILHTYGLHHKLAFAQDGMKMIA